MTLGLPTSAQSPSSPLPSPEPIRPASLAEATVESLFTDFMHYARMGRFTTAEAYAKALLARPDLDPVELMNVANRDRKSLETLLILVKNGAVGESAAKVLALIEKGQHAMRQDPVRIRANIELLGGTPQQEFFAIRRLTESGEYAIPEMVQALLDPAKATLWPRVIRAIPLIGKGAVNALVMAIQTDNEDVRQHLVAALGEIGYVQAVPYLRKLAGIEGITPETRIAAVDAVARIEVVSGRSVPGSAQDLFWKLGDSYYDEDDAVRADPRLDTANVWYWDAAAEGLKRVVVPTKIFGPVMAMRSCEESLLLKNDQTEAISLWLAANTRREARLGMDIESGDPDEKGEKDPTRPEAFPRALYFTQAAGPRYAHLMLERAVRDQDSAVALAAIEALRVTAGETSLIGTEDYKQPLVQALMFPDLAVRIQAALALAAALPKSQFAGSQHVVPVLGGALSLTGKTQVLVVDADEANLNRVVSALRGDDREVVGERNFYKGLERARVELPALSAIFVSTDLSDPDTARALRELRAEFVYSKTPVVLLTKPTHDALARELAEGDPYAEPVDAAVDEADFVAAYGRAASRAGAAAFDGDESLALALEAGESLRRVAVDGRTVFNLRAAEPALIAALSSPHEQLQTLSASVLALATTDTSQRAVAHVALDSGNSKTLRIAAFRSVAESAKNIGNRLEEKQIAELVTIASDEPDLVLRTAASETLGAINLASNNASEIIRSFHGG